MCFTPQRRALFQDLNFQKWSEPLVFLTFWLPNVLLATTACTFSTSQLPKVVRRWGVLYILTSKCASRHNGVHFFDISTSKSRPTLRCFVGTGVAFAPEPCWVAFAPEWSGMKWVQGRMWPSFRGECDPCFCVARAIVSEPQKDFFHPRESYSRVMRRSNSDLNQLPGRYGFYGVPLLRCNIHFEQLRRRFGCYLPRAISINFQDTMDARL